MKAGQAAVGEGVRWGVKLLRCGTGAALGQRGSGVRGIAGRGMGLGGLISGWGKRVRKPGFTGTQTAGRLANKNRTGVEYHYFDE